MQRTSGRYRISLKASLLLVVAFSIVCYFLFSKKYRFPYSFGTSENYVLFENGEVAQSIVGSEFEAVLSDCVVVAVKFSRVSFRKDGGSHAAMWMTVHGFQRRSLPATLRDSSARIPMARNEFIAALQREIDRQLGTTGCRMDDLSRFYPFDEQGSESK